MGTAIKPIDDFKINIGNMEEQFKSALPAHIKSDKFIQVVVTAVRNNSKLLDGNRQALFNACMDCAQDGLLPNGNEAALVVFKGKAKYMPMVTGITKKARNSGEIMTIDSQVVYEKDSYEVWVDEKGPHFKHVKFRGERGKVVATYAYAITKDGGVYHEEIDETGMAAIQKCCNATNSPWKGPFKDEMRRKSALRRLCKYRLPSSTDIDTVIRRDDDMYDLNEAEPVKTETEKEAPSSLEKAVGGKEGEVVDAEFKEEVKVYDTDVPPNTAPENPMNPEPEGEIQQWQTEGKVIALTEKKSPEGSKKKWTKYGCKMNDQWFGTFSSTVYGQMIEAKEQAADVRISFVKERVGKIIVNNIVKFETIWEEEKTQNEETRPDVSDEDLAI